MSTHLLAAHLAREQMRIATDGVLLARYIASHDDYAFAELVRRHGPMVMHLCRRYAPLDSDDAFQAVFLLLVRKAKSIQKPQSLASWLYSTSTKIARRAGQRKPNVPSRNQPSIKEPIDEVSARELLNRLDDELNRLSDAERMPLLLVYWQGRSYADAARELGLTITALHGRLERGRKKLAKRLTARGINSTDLSSILLVPLTNPTVASEVVAQTLTLTNPGVAIPAAITSLCAASYSAKTVAFSFIGVMITGLGLYTSIPAQSPDEKKANEQTAMPVAANSRVDAFGDPLPDKAIRRFGTVRWQYGEQINGLVFAKDGKEFATSGSYGIRWWDTDTGKPLRQWPDVPTGGRTASNSPSITGNGQSIVTCGAGITVWNVKDGKSRSLAAGSMDMPSKEKEAGWQYIDRSVVTNDGNYVVFSCENGQLGVIDFHSEKLVHRLGNNDTNVISLVRAPSLPHIAALQSDGALIIWDVAQGKQLARFQIGTPEEVRFAGLHRIPVAFSPDGRFLAVTSRIINRLDCRIFIFDLNSMQTRKTVLLSEQFNPPIETYSLSIVFSNDSKNLFGTTDRGQLLSLNTEGWETKTHELFYDYSDWGNLYVGNASESLFQINESQITIRSPVNGRISGGAEPPVQSVKCMTITPDGKTIVLSRHSGMINCLDRFSGNSKTISNNLFGTARFAGSPDGSKWVSGGIDGFVRVWDVDSQILKSISGFEKSRLQVQSVFSPNGELIAIGGDSIVALYDVASGNRTKTLTENCEMVRHLTFSRDGKFLSATIRNPDVGSASELRVWAVESGNLVAKANEPIGLDPIFMPDGRSLNWNVSDDQGSKIFDFVKLRNRLSTNRGWDLTMSPTNSWIAETVRDRRNLEIRDAFAGDSVLRGANNGVEATCLTFVPGGRSLLAAYGDGTVIEWDLAPDNLLPSPPDAETIWSELASPDTKIAYRAAWYLRCSDDPAALLRGRLKPVATTPDAEQVRKLISEFEKGTDAERASAEKAIVALGATAEPGVWRQFGDTTSAEFQKRLQGLLKQLPDPVFSHEDRRMLRAVDVLISCNTPLTRKFLRELAAGDPDARLTNAAAAGLLGQSD